MRRFLALGLAAVLSLVLLPACGGDEDQEEKIYGQRTDISSQAPDVTVKCFGFKADAMNLVAIENAVHGFMDAHPGIEIVYEGIKGSAYWDAFKLRLTNRTLDDIVMMHHDWAMALAPRGVLADLSDLSTIGGFSELARTQFIGADGSVYFLPTSISAFGMYVNLDMLKEYNFDVPADWGEFSRQCDYFKEQGITPIIGNNYTTLYTLMSARGLYPVYQLEQEETARLIEQFNSGEADITEYLADGVRMVETMLERGWFDREELANTAQTSDDLALFARGDRPFMITGGWASQRLAALEPRCEFAVYPFPVLEDGSVLVMNVDTCFSVNAASGCLEEAKAFVEYLTQPDVIYEFCSSQSCYTPLKDDRVPADPAIAPAAEYLFNGRSIIGSDFRLKLPIDSAEKTVGEKMLQGMDAEEAIGLLGELLKQ